MAKEYEGQISRMQNTELVGVFPSTTDKAAFIDRIEISVRGDRKDDITRLLANPEMIPIGGKGSLYGRIARGKCLLTRNPVVLKYGKLKRFDGIPDIRIGLRSECEPLTGSQVSRIVDSVAVEPYAHSVSLAEFTFDVTGDLCPALQSGMRSRSSVHFFHGADRNVTAYAGSHTSGWQVRVYPKTPVVSRIEFVLRRQMLRKLRVSSVWDILTLRYAPIGSLVNFVRIHQGALESWLAGHEAEKGELRRRLLPYHLALLENLLDPEMSVRILQRSTVNDKLIQMRGAFVW